MAQKRKPVYSFVDSNDEDDIVYCPYCSKVNVKSKLGPRIYDDNEPLPADVDQFKQCYKCGKIIPIYDVKEELSYGPIVDVINNPFDSGTDIKAVDKRTKKRKKKKDDIDQELAGERGEVNILFDSSGNY